MDVVVRVRVGIGERMRSDEMHVLFEPFATLMEVIDVAEAEGG